MTRFHLFLQVVRVPLIISAVFLIFMIGAVTGVYLLKWSIDEAVKTGEFSCSSLGDKG